MAGLNKNQSSIAICLALALVTLLLYWPMTGHKFINIDDQEYLTENPHVTSGLTWAGVVWAFETGYASNWHPLTWISHMVDVNLYRLDAGGHHLTNLLFHAANTMLLFLLLRQLTGSTGRSAFVAALFAWHPLHVESVAWASERKDVLSTFFWLLAMMAYVQYVAESNAQGSKAKKYYILALVLFALGLMSKPMVVTLPCVLLLIDFWPLQRLVLPGTEPADKGTIKAHPILEKLPFFGLAFAASVVTYLVQKTGGAVSSLEILPLHSRIANAFVAYWRYLAKTIWPVDLAAIYPYPKHWPIDLVIACGLLLILLSGWFLLRASRSPYLAVGWFWFLGTLVPTIGLVQVGSQSIADRYMYIPSIGLFIVIVWGLTDLLDSRRRLALVGIGTVALAACLVLTRIQLGYWQDSVKLFRHAIEVTTDNYIAYNGLGGAVGESGQKDEALALFSRAVEIDPRYAEGQYNLGSALMEAGRLDEGVAHLTASLAHNPKYAQAHNNLGKALLKQGKPEEATTHLMEAVRLRPEYAEAHYNLGTLLLMQSKLDEAVNQFATALRLKPAYPEAHSNLGITLMRQGRFPEGLDQFAETARLRPNDPEAHFNLGIALLQQGRAEDATDQFKSALQLNPGEPKYHYNLGLALVHQHQLGEAIPHYRAALRLNPDLPNALNDLARIYASAPNPDLRDGNEAIRLAKRACELTKSQQPEFIVTLAIADAEAGRFLDAVAVAEQARDLAETTGQKELAAQAAELVKLFQTGQPYRQTL